MSNERCHIETLPDGSQARIQGTLPRPVLEAIHAAVKADQAARCHALSDTPLPVIAQRLHGRTYHWCELYAGHTGPHLSAAIDDVIRREGTP